MNTTTMLSKQCAPSFPRLRLFTCACVIDSSIYRATSSSRTAVNNFIKRR